jgi:DNA-directed RNA polymerase sigma subunit (sigma70/sigma32)
VSGYSNPVIRLQASHGLLASEERIRAERRTAINDLREAGMTFKEIGSILGLTRQRVHQLAKGT